MELDRAACCLTHRYMTLSVIGALALATTSTGEAAFPDARNPPPAGWQGPVFKLSQNYPRSLPSISNPPWQRFDFTNPLEAPQYMNAVLNYCMQGNTANDFADVSQNKVRKWYHAPWLHVGASGREFIHGLTRERPSRVPELGPLHVTNQIQNWAVGFYNSRGGYTLGRVWADEQNPDPTKARFPVHTVSCKLIFTAAPLEEVPYLEGTLEWEADINRASNADPRPKLRLLQLDIAVRDPRADLTTGWVFGTFQYDKDASTAADWWQHLVPVGLMWGNDAPRVLISQPPQEQWVNENRSPQLHLGLRGLLNGPIDNPRSSCTACHALGQIATVEDPDPSLPRVPSENASVSTLQRYLRNIGAQEPYSPDYVSLDYSLQLQVGISNFLEEQATLGRPVGAAPQPAATDRVPRPTRAIRRDEE
jgi:hypothetical protein